jgi:hypothetical protein
LAANRAVGAEAPQGKPKGTQHGSSIWLQRDFAHPDWRTHVRILVRHQARLRISGIRIVEFQMIQSSAWPLIAEPMSDFDGLSIDRENQETRMPARQHLRL